MTAYKNDPTLKADLLREIAWHREQDAIVQGTYGETKGGHWRGCAVGCAIRSLQRLSRNKEEDTDAAGYGDHDWLASRLGVPVQLLHLEDTLFERLPVDEAKLWPERFAVAIQPGADLSMVWPQFALWLIADSEHGVLRFAITDRTREAIGAVADLYKLWVDGERPRESEWISAAAAADAATYAADAADAAAYAATYAADAATYAADAAAYAATYAADAAAYAATYAADARTRHVRAMADKIIELLAGCKP